MKIEIIFCEDIQEECTGMTCYEAEGYISKVIHEYRGDIKGIFTLDKEFSKFSFSPYSMDGDIFSDNPLHRLLIKTMIPIYVYNLMQNKC